MELKRTPEQQLEICKADLTYHAEGLRAGLKELHDELDSLVFRLQRALDREETQALCDLVKEHDFREHVGTHYSASTLMWDVEELLAHAEGFKSVAAWIEELERELAPNAPAS